MSGEAEWESELQDALGDMSIMDMMDAEEAQQRAEAGQNVRNGTVVSVQRDDILVDFGGKSTGLLPIKQLGDEEIPKVGDTIEVTIVGYSEREGLLMLSRKEAAMAAAWDTIAVGQIVEGRVTGHNKGGLEMKIDAIDAFMPISQIDSARVEDDDLPSWNNRHLKVEISEFNRSDKKLIVSRRKVLDREAALQGEKLLSTLKEGDLVTGTVRSIMPYGAFVDLGGVDGLLHIGDMSFTRIEDPKEVVSEGQKIELRVLKIDLENKRIGLGLKQTKADPWAGAEGRWAVGTVVTGRVTKLMEFGAFVEITEGVEGLIPISEMVFDRRISHPKEVVNEGDQVEVKVISVDPDQKRIGLSLKRMADDPWVGASHRWPEGEIVEGVVSRIAAFGAFIELAPGVEGLIHVSELSETRVHNVAEVVKEGQTVSAKVQSVDEIARRISLSIKQIAADPYYTGPVDANAPAEPTTTPRKRKKPLKGGLDW